MNRTILAVIIAGAGLSGAAAYYLFGPQTAPAIPVLTHETVGSGDDAGAAPASPMAGLVDTLPEFELADRNGDLKSLRDWQGKSLIVNFWATWCAPCRREIPLLQAIEREHADDGFQVVGIAVDFREKVLEYADEMKITYPLLIGEQEALDAAAAFGIDAVGFPFTIFTDNSGRVIVAHMGELHAPEADVILDAVTAVNSGAQTPEQARRTIEAGLAEVAERTTAKSAS
jgi:thiol-disulfide isomerase/thioredoxin